MAIFMVAALVRCLGLGEMVRNAACYIYEHLMLRDTEYQTHLAAQVEQAGMVARRSVTAGEEGGVEHESVWYAEGTRIQRSSFITSRKVIMDLRETESIKAVWVTKRGRNPMTCVQDQSVLLGSSLFLHHACLNGAIAVDDGFRGSRTNTPNGGHVIRTQHLIYYSWASSPLEPAPLWQ